MNDRHRRNQTGNFDMNYLVPGLAFYEQFAGTLYEAADRAFELLGDACRRTRRRLSKTDRITIRRD